LGRPKRIKQWASSRKSSLRAETRFHPHRRWQKRIMNACKPTTGSGPLQLKPSPELAAQSGFHMRPAYITDQRQILCSNQGGVYLAPHTLSDVWAGLLARILEPSKRSEQKGSIQRKKMTAAHLAGKGPIAGDVTTAPRSHRRRGRGGGGGASPCT
jgi:hypothetical protein